MKGKRIAWTLGSLAFGAALINGVWRTSDLGKAAGDLDRQRAAAKREGVPMEWDDLRRLAPPIPLADNAAVAYARAFAALKASGGLKGVKPETLMKEIAAGTAKPADLALLRAGLAKAAPALAEAREGSQRQGFSFDRKWELGSALTFPEYADERGLVRAFVLRAMIAKSPPEAADDLRTAARMRAHFGSEPVLIGALVGNGVETDVHRGIRAIGRRGGAWAQAVAPVLDDLGPIPLLQRSLACEAAFGNQFTDELEKSGPGAFFPTDVEGTSTPVAFRLARFRPVREAYQSRVVEFWRGAWAALPTDPTDFRAASAALKIPSGGGLSYAMLDFLMPVFDNFAVTNAKTEANRRLTRAALDLWSGRTPVLAKDPFGAGPLRLKRTGREWTLYSVGLDGLDDGGKPQKKSSDPRYDIAVDSKGLLKEGR